MPTYNDSTGMWEFDDVSDNDLTGLLPGFSDAASPYYWSPSLGTDTPATKSPPAADTGTCWHNWQQYNGLTESYWYCTTCDAKKRE